MADPHDVENTKLVRRQFMRHHVDINQADVRVSHGVVYIRGVIRKQPNAPYADLRQEVERITRILRQNPNIRDVAIDVTFR